MLVGTLAWVSPVLRTGLPVLMSYGWCRGESGLEGRGRRAHHRESRLRSSRLARPLRRSRIAGGLPAISCPTTVARSGLMRELIKHWPAPIVPQRGRAVLGVPLARTCPRWRPQAPTAPRSSFLGVRFPSGITTWGRSRSGSRSSLAGSGSTGRRPSSAWSGNSGSGSSDWPQSWSITDRSPASVPPLRAHEVLDAGGVPLLGLAETFV